MMARSSTTTTRPHATSSARRASMPGGADVDGRSDRDRADRDRAVRDRAVRAAHGRAALALAAAGCLATLGTLGCGSDPPRRPAPAAAAPAGRAAPVPVLYASGSSGPAFGGASGPPRHPAGTNPGGMIGRFIREEDARMAATAYRGPQRIGGQDENAVRITEELLERLPAAEDGPDGPCRDALNLREATGQAGDATEQADFMASCRALPPLQQRCMSPTYQRANYDECTRATTAMLRDVSAQTGIDFEHPERGPAGR